MKRHVLYIFVLLTVGLFTTSCGTLPKIFGKSSAAITSQKNTIQSTTQKIADNNKAKIEDIAVIATGTDHALSSVTNPPTAVVVAKELNQRIISEAGYQPTVEQVKAMYKMVDDLIANNNEGKKELAAKDKQIEMLRNNDVELNKQKDQEVSKYMSIATDVASKADATQNELNKYQAYWGLGGVIIGIKTFAVHVMWIGIGFGALFLILRIFSSTNPIVGALFGIFEQAAAAMIHCLIAIIPKAANAVQTVEASLATKLVDAVSWASTTGTSDLSAVNAQLGNALTDAEKTKMTHIQTKLNYVAPTGVLVTPPVATPTTGSIAPTTLTIVATPTSGSITQ